MPLCEDGSLVCNTHFSEEETCVFYRTMKIHRYMKEFYLWNDATYKVEIDVISTKHLAGS